MATEPPRVSIAAAGPFGERVAQMLGAGLPDCRLVGAGDDISAAFTGGADAVVVALWRPDQWLCEAADDLSFRYGLPWLPVVMEHPAIRVGPAICPPAGPCYRCYARRRVQHDRKPSATAALRAAYERDPECGPAGYLPHHARLAAAIARDLLERMGAGGLSGDAGRTAGEVTTVQLLRGGQRGSRVVACHDCDRCGGRGPGGHTGRLMELSATLPADLAAGVAAVGPARAGAGR
jgi:bacteriocin biosynthesis cyclodehydratase domain-containing protein